MKGNGKDRGRGIMSRLADLVNWGGRPRLSEHTPDQAALDELGEAQEQVTQGRAAVSARQQRLDNIKREADVISLRDSRNT